jgi:predicted transcriptional regulator
MPIDFKKIKSIFVVEPETGDKPKETPSPEKPAAPATPGGPVVQESQAGAPGQVTDKFLQVLFAAMEGQNLPGLDYLEYKQSLNSLSKIQMEEAVRYQSAFAVAQTMGATPQKLVESAAHYIDVLKGEEAKFQQALVKQRTEQIGNREEQIRQMDAAIQQKAEQIKKLTQEIEQHRQQSEKLKLEIGDATGKVESTKNNFIASYNALVSQIQADVDNMKRYLK